MDEEIFEIEDYTNATDIETFISELETALSKALNSNDQQSIAFRGFTYTLFFIHEPIAFQAKSSGFPCTSSSNLQKYFHVEKYFLLSKNQLFLSTESDISLIKSVTRTALYNTVNITSGIPLLFPVGPISRQVYFGTSVNLLDIGYSHTEFSTIHLSTAPAKYAHLTGLKQIFLSKIEYLPEKELLASVRLSYSLKTFKEFELEDERDNEIFKLTSGVCRDPIASIELNCDWSNVNIDLLYDSGSHSDLEPLEAPLWAISYKLDNSPTILASILNSFLELHENRFSQLKAYQKKIHEEDSEIQSNPLDRLGTGLKPTDHQALHQINNLVERTQNLTSNAGGIIQSVGKFILDGPEPTILQQNPLTETTLRKAIDYIFSGEEVGIKSKYKNSAPRNSMTQKLAVMLAILNEKSGSRGAVRQLFEEVVTEIEVRFQNSIYLPGTTTLEKTDVYGENSCVSSPDWNTSLFNQKIQLINCCIAAKRRREFINTYNLQNDEKETNLNEEKIPENSDSDDFYDCESDSSQHSGSESKADKKLVNLEYTDEDFKFLRGPQVVDEETKSPLFLLGDERYPLYTPICQIPPPQTSDDLDKITFEISKEIESDTNESHFQQKTQQAAKDLLSADIAAFKAANPRASNLDFIRWHSPRDFDSNSRELSDRMKARNDWAELWQNTEACPAHNQKRLFDEAQKGLSVIEELKNWTVKDVVGSLKTTLAEAASEFLQVELENIEDLNNKLEQVVKFLFN